MCYDNFTIQASCQSMKAPAPSEFLRMRSCQDCIKTRNIELLRNITFRDMRFFLSNYMVKYYQTPIFRRNVDFCETWHIL
jgi:hypothetical protein